MSFDDTNSRVMTGRRRPRPQQGGIAPSDGVVQESGGEYQPPRNFPGYYNNPQNGGGINPNPGGVQDSGWMPAPWSSVGGYRNPMAGSGNPIGSAPSQWTADSLSEFFKSRGVTPNATSIPYWLSKKSELDQRGAQIGDPNYANARLAAADEIIGGPQNSPFRESAGGSGGSGLNLGWLLQLLASRLGGGMSGGAGPTTVAAPPMAATPSVDLDAIIQAALRRGA